MRISLYRKLAWTNIKKNAKLYIPYIITGVGLVAMFYILNTLSLDERLSQVKGGSVLPTIMTLGVIVVGIMSFILILYTNSFLMKQRAQEFGLYNILGMEKKHICKLLSFESLICLLFILGLGLLSGIILYKLCILIICKLLGVPTVLGFYHISLDTMLPVVIFFICFYALSLVINCVRISLLNPIKLINNSKQGEKEPKIRWILLVVGILSLGSGYAISVFTENPMKAIQLFFLAVILVIVGTYCLFLTGITAVLKALKRNSNFYYQPKHMISVSNLLYRMKQNAVGLASITIMATMVLVMVSSTISLYFGIQKTLDLAYTHQLQIGAHYYDKNSNIINIPSSEMIALTKDMCQDIDLDIEYIFSFDSFVTELAIKDNYLTTNDDTATGNPLVTCYFTTAKDFEAYTGIPIDIKENEIAIFSPDGNKVTIPDKLIIKDYELNCSKKLDSGCMITYLPIMYDACEIIVSDEFLLDKLSKILEKYDDIFQYSNSDRMCIYIDFADINKAEEKINILRDMFYTKMEEYINTTYPNNKNGHGLMFDDVFTTYEELLGVFGSLLFLGLMLSFVFLLATFLVIYYKQISEGHEDRKRFKILQNVGMSTQETKATIKSQLLVLFFLPLVVAALHTCFATPILIRFLKIIFSCDYSIYMICAISAIIIFAVIYALIYKVTTKIYYQIVK